MKLGTHLGSLASAHTLPVPFPNMTLLGRRRGAHTLSVFLKYDLLGVPNALPIAMPIALPIAHTLPVPAIAY